MLIYALLFINIVSVITMYFLNETIAALQRENSKLVGTIQNLHNEVLYLKENSALPAIEYGSAVDYNPKLLLGLLGVLTVAICGLTLLLFLKNDSTVVAELSKNSIKSTGDYVKEVVVPSMELLNKSSESRLLANLDNVKKTVTESSSVVTNHISDVHKEGILCILNTLKPQASIKVMGRISKDLLSYIP